MEKSFSRYQLRKTFVAFTIALSVFGMTSSALAAVVSFDQSAESKSVGNDLAIADWNKLIQSLDGISFDDSGSNDNWGFGTPAVGTHTIATGAGIKVGDVLDVTGLATFNGGVTIETGDTFTYGGQALTTISTGTADNGALVTKGYVDDGIAALDPAIFGITGGIISNENGTYASDDFVFGSSTLDFSTEANRMFFDKSKAAFRAGQAGGVEWNDANVGSYSTAFGRVNKASGFASFVAGQYSTASAFSSIVIGNSSTASGNGSVVIGAAGTAIGDWSITIGNTVTASSFKEIALGSYPTSYTPSSISTWVETDRLFSIGNGVDSNNRSNALTVLKNGSTTIGAPTDGAVLTNAPTGGTALAIATTGYVDTAITDNAVSADNGLTNNSGTIELGGNLTQYTTISNNGFDFLIAGVNGSEIWSDDSEVWLATSAGNTYTYLQPADISNQVTDASGVFSMNQDSSAMTIGSTNGTFQGAVYSADYSGNFVVRSLVDKGYVDVATATTDQIATGGVTCATAGDVGNIGYVAANGGNAGYFEGCIETASVGVYAVVRLSIFEQ